MGYEKMFQFEWDQEKSHHNFQKHGILFTDASMVFDDEYAVTIEDENKDEQRFITLGSTRLGQIIVVVFTFRDEKIRIISARKATSREKAVYFEGITK